MTEQIEKVTEQTEKATEQTKSKSKFTLLSFKQITPLNFAFIVLCATAGLCMGLAFAWPVVLCTILGVIAGLAPVAMPGWSPRFEGASIAERVSLLLIVTIAIGVCVRALVPILSDGAVRVEAAIPLLLVTPPLYLVYIIQNSNSSSRKAFRVTDRLATIFTGPPTGLSLAMGVTVATYCMLLIHYIQNNYPSLVWFADKFLERGIIPPLTLMLFFWGILIFINKAWMLRREKSYLSRDDGVADSTLMTSYQHACKGAGGVSSEQFLETMWKKSLDSYNIPRYINWAVPILGFIGTVLGISLAADGIQNIISNQSSLSQFSSELGQAIAPLGIAFDTTLIALSLSVFLMWLQTMLQRWEDNMLIDFENLIRRETP